MDYHWNSPEIHPDINTVLETDYGYVSDEVAILYMKFGFIQCCNGVYSKKYGWIDTDGNLIDIIGWAEFPKDLTGR